MAKKATAVADKKDEKTIHGLAGLKDIQIEGIDLNNLPEVDDDPDDILKDLFGDQTGTSETVDTVKKEAVKVINEDDLKTVKDRVVFRMAEGVSTQFSFSKVCNVSRQEKDTLLVILYLNENGHDRSQETASFTEVTRENFIAKVNGVYVDTSLLEQYKVSTKYFARTEHFGKIVVSLAK